MRPGRPSSTRPTRRPHPRLARPKARWCKLPETCSALSTQLDRNKSLYVRDQELRTVSLRP
jgi:hypothetical protein